MAVPSLSITRAVATWGALLSSLPSENSNASGGEKGAGPFWSVIVDTAEKLIRPNDRR
jgi:hypothetical protein